MPPRAVVMVLAMLTLAAMVLGSCSRPTPTGDALVAGEAIEAVVSIPPLAEVVRRVLPPGSTVKVLVPVGASPHSHAMTASDRVAIQSADLVVYVGMGLEGQAAGILQSADAARTVEFAKVLEHAAGADDAHDGHEHRGDPHLWLDPALMLELVEAVGEHLAARGDTDARERAAGAAAAIREADARARERLDSVKGSRLITQHNAWQRFADHFGLQILGSVLPVGSGEPTAGDMSRAAKAVSAARAKSAAPIAVMTEPQLNPRPAERLAEEMELPLGVLDPLGDGDWFALLEANVSVLIETLAAKGEGP